MDGNSNKKKIISFSTTDLCSSFTSDLSVRYHEIYQTVSLVHIVDTYIWSYWKTK